MPEDAKLLKQAYVPAQLAIFRGTLDVRAKAISDEMCMAAAEEMASVAEEEGLDADRIIPSMSEWELFPREAAAVGTEAVKQGLAGVKLSRRALYEKANETITRARKSTEMLMRRGLIKGFPTRSKRRDERRVIQR